MMNEPLYGIWLYDEQKWAVDRSGHVIVSLFKNLMEAQLLAEGRVLPLAASVVRVGLGGLPKGRKLIKKEKGK